MNFFFGRYLQLHPVGSVAAAEGAMGEYPRLVGYLPFL
jgi:hypothetical protein